MLSSSTPSAPAGMASSNSAERGDFHFHVVTRRALLKARFDGRANPSHQAQVVPLDQDAVIQAQAVILARHPCAPRIFAELRKPGVVLRVSRNSACVPANSSFNRRA